MARPAVTHRAYRAFCEARKGAPLVPGEYEAIFSRVEYRWIAAVVDALEDDDETEPGDEECYDARCGYDDSHNHGPECTRSCPCGRGEVS